MKTIKRIILALLFISIASVCFTAETDNTAKNEKMVEQFLNKGTYIKYQHYVGWPVNNYTSIYVAKKDVSFILVGKDFLQIVAPLDVDAKVQKWQIREKDFDFYLDENNNLIIKQKS